jgi:predicted nucleic acid-binding protein
MRRTCSTDRSSPRSRLKSLHANLSAYDAQYVALAEALNIPLITADARIKRSGVARCKVEVFDAHT